MTQHEQDPSLVGIQILQKKQFPSWLHACYFVLGWLTCGIAWMVWIVHYIIYKLMFSNHNFKVEQATRRLYR